MSSSNFIEDDNTFITQDKNQHGWDLSSDLIGGDTGQSALHRKREEMKQVDAELLKMKADTQAVIERVEQGEQDFKRKQESFQNQIEQFQKFILESDRKRAAKLRQAEDERRQRLQKEQILEQKHHELRSLQDKCDELQNDLQRLRRYQVFLNSVVRSNSDVYSFIDDILQRYVVLEDVNHQLVQATLQSHKNMEEIGQSLQKMVKEKQNDLLVKNSEVARCLKKMDDAQKHAAGLEENIHSWHRRSQETMRISSQVKAAISNLYERSYESYATKKPVYRNRKAVEIEEMEFNEKTEHHQYLLDEVGQRVVDIMDIIEVYSKSNKENQG